jgi:hypothetical protein
MLKKIAISTLFVVAATLAGVGGAVAKTGVAKVGKVDVTQKANGFCPNRGGSLC